jgi:hypothetical protein
MVKSVIGYITAALLIGLGLLFAWASSVQMASTRLPIGITLIAAGVGILYLIKRERPREMVQRIEVTGGLKARQIQCPSCSASLNLNEMKVTSGVPTIECRYCGNNFEMTEEPKW